jgi:hypothetical protein
MARSRHGGLPAGSLHRVTLDLQQEAGHFGQELQELLDSVLPYQPGVDPATRQVAVTAAGLSFAVEIGTAHGKSAQPIPLLTKRRKTAELLINIRLVADSVDRYPAVSKSTFVVRIEHRFPLLRLDFDKAMYRAPGCHWNVHAERAAMSKLLLRNRPRHSGEVSDVHLPVGGARMRPCLEDVLQLLVVDFGFDAESGALDVIKAGRVRWRRRQLAAMVRDDSQEAVRVLEELGYRVTSPPGGPLKTRLDRLERW